MEDDLPPDPVIVNGTDEDVTIYRIVREEITRPGMPNRTVEGHLESSAEMTESSLTLCANGNGILTAENAQGQEIDRWDSEDCPDGEVPDEWIITDTRPGATTEPDP